MDSATALREAVARLRRPAVLAFGLAFTIVGIASIVARQTLVAAWLDLLLAMDGGAAALPVSSAELRPVPLALSLDYGAALALVAGLALIAEYLHVVALRLFADWESTSGAATSRVIVAVLVGFLVGVIVRGAVLVGLIALVLPGAFLAAALLFAHARVAIAGDGVFAALRNSWSLTAGRRLRVLGVVAVLLGFYLLPWAMGGLVPDERVSLIVTGILLGPANLLSAGVIARAYVALEAETVAAAEGDDEPTGEEEDPWNQPLGPDDLPEP